MQRAKWGIYVRSKEDSCIAAEQNLETVKTSNQNLYDLQVFDGRSFVGG
jgi:hypothetical protein